MSRHPSRVAFSSSAIAFALVLVAPSAALASDDGDGKGKGRSQDGHNPPGNNGTIKIDYAAPTDSGHANRPHPGCAFQLRMFGFDDDQYGSITFVGQAPTKLGTLLTQPHVLLSSDDAGGGKDVDEVYSYTTEQLGLIGKPQAKQGWHIKVSVDADNAPGGAKHKVFWLMCSPARSAGTDSGASTQGGSTTSTNTSTQSTTTITVDTVDTASTASGSATGLATQGATQGATLGATQGAATTTAAGTLARTSRATAATAGAGTAGAGTAAASAGSAAAPGQSGGSALPFTGIALGSLIALALGALTAGALAIRAGRRRNGEVF